MSSTIDVAIHASQFPEKVQRDLLDSLLRRQVNHKFHYDSHKQTQQWLELHQAYSPSRTDPNCAECYEAAFAAAAKEIRSASVHLIGLGCGGGQKDASLLRRLREGGRQLHYTPVDVSTAMVLVACQTAASVSAETRPLVCDLGTADDLASVFAARPPAHAPRLITFFGMIPNFEPAWILPRLAGLLSPGDRLLLSANLAPGPDYAAGLRRILPLYDNDLTRIWLLTFLLDLGVERTDGSLEWSIEPCPSSGDLQRLTASFGFVKPRRVRIAGKEIQFAAGERIRLFFSYRYTPERVREHLSKHGLAVRGQWITDSEEEGVFLVEVAEA